MDNIDRDPRFVDAQAGNVNLSRNSPARMAGDSDAPQLPSSDFAGNPVGDPPDMGALQFVGGGGGGGGGGGCSVSNIETDTRSNAAGILLLIMPLILIMVRRIRVPD